MGQLSSANNSPAVGGPDNKPDIEPDRELDPIDRAFLAQRFAGGPLVFGAISIITSVCILGLVPGTLGLRSGIDLWRAGCRRTIVIAGIATSAVGIVASVIGALLWGALLAGILLGRDAMRETERWRGRTVDACTLDAWHPDGRQVIAWPIVDGGTDRLALLFITTDPATDPIVTTEAITSAARVAAAHPTCRFAVVAPFASAEEAQSTVIASGTPCAIVHAPIELPQPLDAVSAFPTLVTIDRSGRIEFALVGARGDDELARIFSGESARKALELEMKAEAEPSARRSSAPRPDSPTP